MSEADFKDGIIKDIIKALTSQECTYSLNRLASLLDLNSKKYGQQRYEVINSLTMVLHVHILKILCELKKDLSQKAEYIEEAFDHLNEIIYGSFRWALTAKLQQAIGKGLSNDFSTFDSDNVEEKLGILACLLSEVSGLLPDSLHEEFIFDLDTLLYGDVPNLLKPIESGKHRPAGKLEKLRIKAHQHIAFRTALNAGDCWHDVATAYGLTPEAIKKHKTRTKGAERKMLYERENWAKLRATYLLDYLSIRKIEIPPLIILRTPKILDDKITEYLKQNNSKRIGVYPLHPYSIRETIKQYSEETLLAEGSQYQLLNPKAQSRPPK